MASHTRGWPTLPVFETTCRYVGGRDTAKMSIVESKKSNQSTSKATRQQIAPFLRRKLQLYLGPSQPTFSRCMYIQYCCTRHQMPVNAIQPLPRTFKCHLLRTSTPTTRKPQNVIYSKQTSTETWVIHRSAGENGASCPRKSINEVHQSWERMRRNRRGSGSSRDPSRPK